MSRLSDHAGIAPLNSLPSSPLGKHGWPWTVAPEKCTELTPSGKLWPKISIVTPSYNQGQFLEATICSILGQNYPNLEYIVIDGGSTDNSVEIIKKYERHLAYWVSEKDAGQYDAINKGFARSTGEIMAWLNSDDMYLPWVFRTIGEIFSDFAEINWLTSLNPGTWDYAGNCRGFGSKPGFSRQCFLDGVNLPIDGRGWWIQQESTFWRRSLWEKAGGLDTTVSLAGDFDLWCQFWLHENLYGTTAPLGGFRFQELQRSKNIEKYIAEAEKCLRRTRLELNYSENYLRMLVRKSRYYRFSILRNLFRNQYSYSGRCVGRVRADSPSGQWAITTNSFF